MKVLKILITIVLFLLIATGGFGTYYFYSQAKKENLRANDLATQLNKAKDEITSIKSTSEALVSSSDNSTCDTTLTSRDQTDIAGWKIYENDEQKYSLKYPSTWTVDSSSSNNVTFRGKDSGENITLQVKTGTSTETGFADLTKVFSEEKTISCLKSTETTYDGEDNLTMIVDSFKNKQNQPILILFSFKDIGASYAGDLSAQYNLILKTFEVRE